MGVVLFENTGTFKPSDYGIEPGMQLDIICVGGGGGGGAPSAAGGGAAGRGGDAGKGGEGPTDDDAGYGGGGGGGAGYGGGGGGGGGYYDMMTGGGGGGGQLVTASLVVTEINVSTSFPVTVGAGGTGTKSRNTISTAGEASSFGNICTAAGGVRGADGYGDAPPASPEGATKGGAGACLTANDEEGSGGGGGGGGWIPGMPFGMRTDGSDAGGFSNSGTGGAGGGGGSYESYIGSDGQATTGGRSVLGGDGGNGCRVDPTSENTITATNGQDGGVGHGCVVICWD